MGRRKSIRRAKRALVLQVAIASILCGLAITLFAGAEMYADHRYDGEMDRWTPYFCWVEQAPEPFLPTCSAE